jgi:hypothetical protein
MRVMASVHIPLCLDDAVPIQVAVLCSVEFDAAYDSDLGGGLGGVILSFIMFRTWI